jgi:hypothetical protein
MKNRLLVSLLLGSASMGMFAQYTVLQDLTSSIQNADFTADAPVTETIRTYDYDMADDGAGNGGVALFGLQPVTGWTANTPSDNIKMEKDTRTDGANARAAGIFAYDDESQESYPGLGGDYFAPYLEEGLTRQALGIVAVWGAEPKYTQSISLPAGAYMLIAKVYNAAGGGTVASNFFGFTAADGTAYMSAKETYAVQQWENDTVVFQLEEATEGEISLGFSFGSGSGSAPHLFIDNVKLYSIDVQALIQEQIALQKAELLKLIEIGQDYGVDTSEAQAVYDNPNATLEDVAAAIVAQEAINAAGVTDLSPAFMTNSHFSLDDPLEGGICTYDYDCEKNNIPLTNFSMLPVTGWERTKTDNGCASGVYAIGSGAFLGGVDYIVPTVMSDGSTEGKVLGFVTCWTMAVQYKQNVTLPPGKYTLKMSYYNTGGTQAIDKNLIGFVADDGTEYLATTKIFPIGKWTTEEVSFELAEQTAGYFSLGYKSVNTGSGNMPHFFTDGIAIYYVGTDIDPTFLALQAAVSQGEAALENEFNADLYTQLEQAVATGRDLVDNSSDDEEANKAATAAINSLMEQVTPNIAAYTKLQTFREVDLEEALAKYQETIPDLFAELEKLADDVDAALDEKTWTTDKINEVTSSLAAIEKAGVQKAFDAVVAAGERLDTDLDITAIFDQMAYTYSTSAQSGASVPDKEWQYGDASNFKTQYGTAEVWNQSPFQVSRTLKDLPAGKYTVTTKAYYRSTNNNDNYNEYVAGGTEPLAFVFAGNVKAPITNVAAIAAETPDAFVASTQIEGVEAYVPNNQEAAHGVFNDPNYAEQLTTSVSTVLTDKGDITFGVTADQLQADSWVVWYSFNITYNAADDDALSAELAGALEVLREYVEANTENMNALGANSANSAIETAEAAIDGTTEDMAAAIKTVNEALSAAKANVKVYTEYLAIMDKFDAAINDYAETASDKALEAYNEVSERMDGIDDLTTDEITDLTASMIRVIGLIKLPAGYEAATAEAPVDFTQVIENNSFETGDLTGWTYNTKATGDTGAKESGAEGTTYYISNVDGIYVFNTWHGSALDDGYYVSQTIGYLPAGTYELSALLASDLANKISLAAGSTSVEFEMPNDKTSALDTTITFKVMTEGEAVDIKAFSSTWFKADNFRLTYLGASTKVTVTDITTLIDAYLQPETTVTVTDITALIDLYLNQTEE